MLIIGWLYNFNFFPKNIFSESDFGFFTSSFYIFWIHLSHFLPFQCIVYARIQLPTIFSFINPLMIVCQFKKQRGKKIHSNQLVCALFEVEFNILNCCKNIKCESIVEHIVHSEKRALWMKQFWLFAFIFISLHELRVKLYLAPSRTAHQISRLFAICNAYR